MIPRVAFFYGAGFVFELNSAIEKLHKKGARIVAVRPFVFDCRMETLGACLHYEEPDTEGNPK